MNNAIIVTILQESLLLFFTIGSLFALILGLLYLFAPQLAGQFSQHSNRWLSLRRSTRVLEIPRSVEHNLYHHHRLLGLFILLCAAYILYRFGFDYHHEQTVTLLAHKAEGSSVIVTWLLESLLWFLLPVSLLLILFGAVMATKPSSLKPLEQFSNRWISTRKLMQPIERQNDFLDGWVTAHPRLFGLVLSLAALYNLTLLLLFLFNKYR